VCVRALLMTAEHVTSVTCNNDVRHGDLILRRDLSTQRVHEENQ